MPRERQAGWLAIQAGVAAIGAAVSIYCANHAANSIDAAAVRDLDQRQRANAGGIRAADYRLEAIERRLHNLEAAPPLHPGRYGNR